ncbi:MAG: hypothetical protein HYU31_19080 [Deltaproteobacteria bacterium]|nr:hypothetical protein [Deltaproteobacteria bacterium]MBI2229456.1 hypothetical protein [Deltaproteobacteria bacterium]MBI3067026.1 hypothetical protein [Deltaproteobacteria bacterium]
MADSVSRIVPPSIPADPVPAQGREKGARQRKQGKQKQPPAGVNTSDLERTDNKQNQGDEVQDSQDKGKSLDIKV